MDWAVVGVAVAKVIDDQSRGVDKLLETETVDPNAVERAAPVPVIAFWVFFSIPHAVLDKEGAENLPFQRERWRTSLR